MTAHLNAVIKTYAQNQLEHVYYQLIDVLYAEVFG